MEDCDSQPLQIRAAAAAWLARLRSETHTQEDQAAFQQWLAADPAHEAAFQAITAVWDAARPTPADLVGKRPAIRTGLSRRAVFGGAAAAAGIGGSLVLVQMAEASVYRTQIGEQRRIALGDGTQLFLDTNTKVTVDIGKNRRKAALEYGCASFRLAPDLSRPFSVDVAHQRVVGNASTFDVRREGAVSQIVSLQGQVSVTLPDGAAGRILKGGERLICTDRSVTLDKPDLLPLLAWHTGQAIFRDETLVEAASEMNRYSTQRLEIADPRIRGLKVSGVYRVGDNLIFARALAALLPVAIVTFDDRIEIVADPERLRKI